MPDIQKAAEHIYKAFYALGVDVKLNDSTKETPLRVAKYWASVLNNTSLGFVPTCFDAKDCDELVIVKDIEFSSLCEHHMLPFFGTAHVGYLPNGKILGLSKIPRLVDFCAKRPQTQEYLTTMIGEYMQEFTEARFVGVVLNATHTCVGCRGVSKLGCTTTTSYFSPKGPDLDTTKKEFLSLLR